MTAGYDGTLWKSTAIGLRKGARPNPSASSTAGSEADAGRRAGDRLPGQALGRRDDDVYRSTDNGLTWQGDRPRQRGAAVASTGTGTTLAGNISGL